MIKVLNTVIENSALHPVSLQDVEAVVELCCCPLQLGSSDACTLTVVHLHLHLQILIDVCLRLYTYASADARLRLHLQIQEQVERKILRVVWSIKGSVKSSDN